MLSMVVVVVVGDRNRRPAPKVGRNSWLETSNVPVLLIQFRILVFFVGGGTAMSEEGGVRRPQCARHVFAYITSV